MQYVQLSSVQFLTGLLVVTSRDFSISQLLMNTSISSIFVIMVLFCIFRSSVGSPLHTPGKRVSCSKQKKKKKKEPTEHGILLPLTKKCTFNKVRVTVHQVLVWDLASEFVSLSSYMSTVVSIVYLWFYYRLSKMSRPCNTSNNTFLSSELTFKKNCYQKVLLRVGNSLTWHQILFYWTAASCMGVSEGGFQNNCTLLTSFSLNWTF